MLVEANVASSLYFTGLHCLKLRQAEKRSDVWVGSAAEESRVLQQQKGNASEMKGWKESVQLLW